MPRDTQNSMKNMFASPRVCIATPCRDSVLGTFTYDLVQLIRKYPETAYLSAFGIYIHNLRNQLVEAALAGGYSHILFIDSDMRFPADTAVRLLKAGVEVIGANCKQRTRNQWTARKDAGFVSSTDRIGREQVDALGMGVTLIDLKVFKKLEKPWFSIAWDKDNNTHVGEDTSFCYRLFQKHIPIWIDHDLSQMVRHTGSTEFGATDR